MYVTLLLLRVWGPHGHKFLAGGRMDRHTVVKVCLGGAHLDGHPEPLEHLVTAAADHVKADHPLLWALADQLHHCLRLPGGHRVIQRSELGLVHSHIITPKLLSRFFLRQTDTSDLKDGGLLSSNSITLIS